MSEFLDFAEQTVRKAAESVRDFRLSDKLHDKKDGDLVTSGDLEVEKEITGAIARHYPDHGFLSEEGTTGNPGADYQWILDPIDGTKHYVREVPLYTISLALRKNDELITGVVYSPQSEQMFRAEKDHGAELNGRPIRCSSGVPVDKLIVCAEIPGGLFPEGGGKATIGKFHRLVQNVLRVRLLGTSSLTLCWTAMGGFDAYVNLGSGSKIWDIAAGLVVLKEAGAKITDDDGRIIAADPAIHDKLTELLEI